MWAKTKCLKQKSLFHFFDPAFFQLSRWRIRHRNRFLPSHFFVNRLQLFTFVINSNNNTSDSQPLRGAEAAERDCVSSRGCGRLFCRFCLVVLDYDSSLGCGFFLLFASLLRSFRNHVACSHLLWIFCGPRGCRR